jgi:hypothetical protein
MCPNKGTLHQSSENIQRPPFTLAERRDLILDAWIAIDELGRAKAQLMMLIEKLSVKSVIDVPNVDVHMNHRHARFQGLDDEPGEDEP